MSVLRMTIAQKRKRVAKKVRRETIQKHGRGKKRAKYIAGLKQEAFACQTIWVQAKRKQN